MITHKEITKKSLRLYYTTFLNAFINNEEIFPLEIPSNKGKSTDQFLKRYDEIKLLLLGEKTEDKSGYSINFKKVNTKKQGIQSIPDKVFFESENDFLGYIKKKSEYKQFKINVQDSLNRIPEMAIWVKNNLKKIIDFETEWEKLLIVCEYFFKNNVDGFYIRELPVKVHTKFIEQHKGILKSIFDVILPEGRINSQENNFEKRYGLRFKPPVVRFRTLDDSVSIELAKLKFSDLAVPVSEFESLAIAPTKVFIVENEINFLTFPLVEDSIVIWGKGFAVENLKNTTFLKNVTIIYWGDIDCAGFSILSQLRSFFPKTRTIMMDLETWNEFKEFSVLDNKKKMKVLNNLTEEESEIYNLIINLDDNNRLEQEKIPHTYALGKIQYYLIIQ